MESESDLGSLQRHPEFWFDDGSIVVCVEDTAFKVHRSLLARQSEIFADLFSLPQPTDAARIEGCPIVQLPDRRSDFVDLLKALYNPLHFDTLPPESKLDPTLDFTEGILHLSKKYFITGLRTKCLSLITALRLCPTTPFQANFMYDRMGALTPEGCISDAVTVTSLIRLIHVALDLDATDVFKLSFPYYIVATRIKPDLLLVPAAVGLSCEGKLLCMVAREKLRLAWKDCYAFLHQFRPSKDCLTRSECSSAKGVLSEWSRIKNSVVRPTAAVFRMENSRGLPVLSTPCNATASANTTATLEPLAILV